MIVVADTGPLIYLQLVGAIDCLPRMFGQVHVPGAVLRELQSLRNPALEAVRSWATEPPSWIIVLEPAQVDPTLLGLQDGESAAISLAQELRANRTLLDDGHARARAREEGRGLDERLADNGGESRTIGHKVVGTLGILEAAAELGLIPDLPGRLDHLVARTPFRCGPSCLEIVREMKRRDGERKRTSG